MKIIECSGSEFVYSVWGYSGLVLRSCVSNANPNSLLTNTVPI